jgi:hypothetical protein
MDAYFPNGYLQYIVGGACIGLGVSLLFVMTGLVGGMSSVYSSTWSFVLQRPFFQQAKFLSSRQWRLFYAAGLILGIVGSPGRIVHWRNHCGIWGAIIKWLYIGSRHLWHGLFKQSQHHGGRYFSRHSIDNSQHDGRSWLGEVTK